MIKGRFLRVIRNKKLKNISNDEIIDFCAGIQVTFL
jgi:hypothetical protein